MFVLLLDTLRGEDEAGGDVGGAAVVGPGPAQHEHRHRGLQRHQAQHWHSGVNINKIDMILVCHHDGTYLKLQINHFIP